MSLNQTGRADLIPWSWVITPIDPSTTSCPSSSRILGTFALVNIITFIPKLLFGNANFIHMVTCSVFGKERPAGMQPWVYMSIVPLGCQLAANALIAAITINDAAPNYRATFSIGNWVLFFCARPRLGWLFARYAATIPDKRGQPTNRFPYWGAFMSGLAAEQD
jgi:hypothetical protein